MTQGTDQYDTAGYENPNRFVEKRNLQPHLLINMRGHRGFLLEVPPHAGMFSPRAANPT